MTKVNVKRVKRLVKRLGKVQDRQAKLARKENVLLGKIEKARGSENITPAQAEQLIPA